MVDKEKWQEDLEDCVMGMAEDIWGEVMEWPRPAGSDPLGFPITLPISTRSVVSYWPSHFRFIKEPSKIGALLLPNGRRIVILRVDAEDCAYLGPALWPIEGKQSNTCLLELFDDKRPSLTTYSELREMRGGGYGGMVCIPLTGWETGRAPFQNVASILELVKEAGKESLPECLF